jgi:DNA-directed RNA polymerase specialized sigma24 family protein
VGERDAQFRDFVTDSQRRLVHFAELLVGDRGRAEDLVQEGYVAAYAAWPRIRNGAPEAYVRRCVMNRRVDWWRRRSSREWPVDQVADLPDDSSSARTADGARACSCRTSALRGSQRSRDRDRDACRGRHRQEHYRTCSCQAP